MDLAVSTNENILVKEYDKIDTHGDLETETEK